MPAMEENLRSYGFLREVDAEAKTVTAVISTGDVARDDAVIDPAGWDFTHYDQNPVVLDGHNDSSVLGIVARTRDRKFEDGKLIATAEFDQADENAMRVFGKIERGFLRATSVRWHPRAWEFRDAPDRGGRHEEQDKVLTFIDQELLEWSFVPVPADPGALIVRQDGQPLLLSAFGQKTERDIVAEFLDHTEAIAAILGEAGQIDTRRLDGEAVVTVRAARDALVTLLNSRQIETPEEFTPEEVEEIAGKLNVLLEKRNDRASQLMAVVGANIERN